MINVKTVPKNIKNNDEYQLRKMLSQHGNTKEKLITLYRVINRNVKSIEQENISFNEIFNLLYPLISNIKCGFVYNPKTKYCNNRVFDKNIKINDNTLNEIIDIFINEFNLEVIDNFKEYQQEARNDVLYELHNDNLHNYGVIAFTDAIPTRYELDKDYGKTYDLLHRFSVYYHSKLVNELLEKEFSNIL